MFDEATLAQLEANYRLMQPRQAPVKKKKGGRGGTLTSLISEGGAIGGGAAGAAIGSGILPGIGTLLGGALGAGIGAFGGRVTENKVRDDRIGLGDAAKESLFSAVLGGGPVRLGKTAFDAAKAVKGGTALTDALIKAGEKSVNSSARGAVGKKLTQASDDLAIKGFRLTPTQITNFKNKFGEDPSKLIKKYNLTGKDSEVIRQTVIDPLQGEFDAIAAKIPAIPTETIKRAFQAKYGKLITSAVEDNKVVGRQLKQQADSIVKKYGATVEGNEIAALRREFDSLVSYADKTANPARYNVNKRAADALRNVLQDTADKVGLKTTGGATFKEVGRELNKLYQLTENIGRQEGLGRGSLPLSLPGLLGAAAGSGAGPAGVLLGGVATTAVNSPMGRKAIASGAEKLGSRLTEGATTRNPFSVKQVASRILPPSGVIAANNADQDFLSSNIATTDTTTSAAAIPSAANMDGLSQIDDNLSTSDSPFAPQNLESAIQQIIANGGTLEDASKFASLAQALQKIQETSNPVKKPMSAEAAKVTSNAQLGLQALSDLENTIASDPSALRNSVIPGRGVAGGVLGRALGTQELDAARQQVIDVIARLRTGAAITNDEAKRFTQFLPVAADTPDVQAQKLNYLRQQFTDILQRTGSASNSLEDALMTAQPSF